VQQLRQAQRDDDVLQRRLQEGNHRRWPNQELGWAFAHNHVSALAADSPTPPHAATATTGASMGDHHSEEQVLCSPSRGSVPTDTQCNGTVQIIRAQVQKQSREWSNSRTWAHITPVVQ
jgi:hypothetical protein